MGKQTGRLVGRVGERQTYVEIDSLKLLVLLEGVLSQLRHLEHEGQTLLEPRRKETGRKGAASRRDSGMTDGGEGGEEEEEKAHDGGIGGDNGGCLQAGIRRCKGQGMDD